MDSQKKYIGFLRYSGESVKDGFLDARKSAEALLGFDEALHYFLSKEDTTLADREFEIPVRIRKGSWEVLVPVLQQLFSPGGVLVATGGVYLSFTAKKAAEDGFFETGVAKDISKSFKAAIISMQWVIRIASHLRSFAKSQVKAKIIQNDGELTLIEITNYAGKKLVVPKEYFDKFVDCPPRIFSKNAKIIKMDRILEVGVYDKNIEKVTITDREKYIFSSEDKDEDVLFPELKHGQSVELEGIITKGNEKTNTIGFEFKEHILTSKPQSGNIVDYKNKILSDEADHIFPKIKIVGIIDREDQNGEFKEKRPRIIFSDIIPLEQEEKQKSLFD